MSVCKRKKKFIQKQKTEVYKDIGRCQDDIFSCRGECDILKLNISYDILNTSSDLLNASCLCGTFSLN